MSTRTSVQGRVVYLPLGSAPQSPEVPGHNRRVIGLTSLAPSRPHLLEKRACGHNHLFPSRAEDQRASGGWL